MALDFTMRDIIHRITVKFVHAFLPKAKKKYNLKAVFQPELDIHGIASKAELYNITTSPRVIEEGLTAGMELMSYLTADGFKIKTPLFYMRIRIPGEYDGAETQLGEGLHPELRMQVSAAFRKYIGDTVQVEFDGLDDTDGFISEAYDEASKTTDTLMTPNNLLTIYGYGLKVEGDADHTETVGIYFDTAGSEPVKAAIVAVNEPRTLKIIVPPGLIAGSDYHIRVETQSSAKHGAAILKNLRECHSDFTLALA